MEESEKEEERRIGEVRNNINIREMKKEEE
jgi:hypothetical protein